ncbi:DEAD/DEAH box helicase [Photobacterium leiognathi]|uniref:DEAD/DEAH box helicase n=1 Tax=Photobacterium leiognathi TaxID=553611 RepID=UPI00298127E4|nr:DEAD/DEAH box helicase [Photobacterium leiognathi]
MKIKQLLVRSGESGLSELISHSLLEILYEFEKQPTIKRLTEVILEIYGEQTYIDDAKKRKKILQYLTKEEATELCVRLGLNKDEPWNSLANFNLNSERRELLNSFFDIESHKPPEKKQENEEYHEIIEPRYPLFIHQEKAAKEIKEYLSTPKSRVLLHMPTGSGKTRTAMSIAVDFLRNEIVSRDQSIIVWLADTYELCEQAYSEFVKAWSYLGVGETNIYKVYGNSDVALSDIKHGFVVCGLQKLNSIRQQNVKSFYSFGKKANLVVFDEAHKVVAPTYQHMVELFQENGKAAILGLSATPGRSTYDHERNINFAEFFNYQKVTLAVEGYSSPVDYLEKEGYLAKVSYHEIPYEPKDLKFTKSEILALEQGSDISERSLKVLGMEAQRNIKILSLCLEQVALGKKVILFACSVESAEAIFALLRYNNVAAGIVTSNTPEDLRKDTIDRYKEPRSKQEELKILVNFGVLTTGFDAPITNVAIIARPTNSLTLFSQMVGRATRGIKAKGNELSNVYYIKDTLSGMVDMVTAFSHWDDVWN